MSTKEVKTKKHLTTYSIWYRICLVIMALVAVCYVVTLVGWITGYTMDFFLGMDKQFTQLALESPYLILFMNYFGIALCAIMAILFVVNIFLSTRDKESTFDRIRSLMAWTIFSIWAVPLFHAIADFAATAMKIRTPTSYDVFSLHMSIWPMLILTALAVVVIMVNNLLGEVPADEEIE